MEEMFITAFDDMRCSGIQEQGDTTGILASWPPTESILLGFPLCWPHDICGQISLWHDLLLYPLEYKALIQWPCRQGSHEI